MKDYEHIVIWLDYFNKTFSRRVGRRVNKDLSVYDPSLKELSNAAKSAGFKIIESDDNVRYPRRAFVRSGYIILEKGSSKSKVIRDIATKLVSMKK